MPKCIKAIKDLSPGKAMANHRTQRGWAWSSSAWGSTGRGPLNRRGQGRERHRRQQDARSGRPAAPEVPRSSARLRDLPPGARAQPTRRHGDARPQSDRHHDGHVRPRPPVAAARGGRQDERPSCRRGMTASVGWGQGWCRATRMGPARTGRCPKKDRRRSTAMIV